MAIEAVPAGRSETDLYIQLAQFIARYAYIFVLIGAVVAIGIVAYIIMKRKEEQADPFLAEYQRIAKDLKKTAPKPKKILLNVFEPLGLVMLLVFSLIGAITIWLFDLRIAFFVGMLAMVGYGMFEKLGVLSAYTTRVYLISDKTTRFLGYYINDVIQPKGWNDFLITKSRWLKKPEIYRVNAKGEEEITHFVRIKDKKTGQERVEERKEIIKLPTGLVRKDGETILIKGRDTKTYRYFNYITHTDENGEPVDLDLIITAREVKRMTGVDLIPTLASDWSASARQLIGANSEVAKFQKMGSEGVDEES